MHYRIILHYRFTLLCWGFSVTNMITKLKTKDYYFSTIAPFYHIRAKEHAKYATLLHCRTGQKYGLKRSEKMAAQINEPNFALFTSWNGGIINPLFDGLTYNTSGHFAHCSYFPRPYGARKNTTQLTKYPRVLYVRPTNKVYLFYNPLKNQNDAKIKFKKKNNNKLLNSYKLKNKSSWTNAV